MRSTLFILSFAAGLAVMGAQTSVADEPTYEQIVAAVLKESRAAYARRGERCICPYDRAADGRLCGKRSLYKKSGGRSPLCYPPNVGSGEIQRYLFAHPN